MPKLDKISFHNLHHSRNIGLLSEEEQRIIDSSRLLIAGCGVGSQIALSAARVGFENFLIVDGDKVEISNINRQGYSWRDEGRYKVDALSRKIKSINPHASIKKFPLFVGIDNADKLVKNSDIIIDAIDPFSAIAIIALHRAARKYKKSVIIPVDTGWGAAIIIYTPSSISYDESIGINPKTFIGDIDENEAFNKVATHLLSILPEYAKKIAIDAAYNKNIHYPQPITAVNIISALTVDAAKRLALKQPTVSAPNFVSFDPDIALSTVK
ncbi:MAG: ThiF family adenylyltransferase [Candidatus Berkelbacteria bacterium]|nr:ThiF family adenylyltransferase [Candidatus Berkelbacteria bacterium]